MCRIADVLIALHQVGNVKYIGWKMDFFCKDLLVMDLQEQAKEMEDDLESWNQTMSLVRNQFYELNYYTTLQLLVLRSELGKIKSSGLATREAYLGQVLTLLESISSEITPAALEQVVTLVNIENEDEKDNVPPPLVEYTTEKPSSENLSTPQVNKVTEQTVRSGNLPILPPVSLSRETLTKKQEEQCTDIIESYNYSEMIALKAIEAVGDGDWNDIMNWLEENGDEWEQNLIETQESDEEGIENEDTDVESEDVERLSGIASEDEVVQEIQSGKFSGVRLH